MAIEAGYNVRCEFRVHDNSNFAYRILCVGIPLADTKDLTVDSFMGPEKPLTILEDRLEGIEWSGTGVGMGIRGSAIPELVIRLEGEHTRTLKEVKTGPKQSSPFELDLITHLLIQLDIIQTYRDVTPDAHIYFNYMPNTTLWAIQRNFPLSSNCTDSPGKNLVCGALSPASAVLRYVLTRGFSSRDSRSSVIFAERSVVDSDSKLEWWLLLGAALHVRGMV